MWSASFCENRARRFDELEARLDKKLAPTMRRSPPSSPNLRPKRQDGLSDAAAEW